MGQREIANPAGELRRFEPGFDDRCRVLPHVWRHDMESV